MPMRIGDAMPCARWGDHMVQRIARGHFGKDERQADLVHFWAVSCGICKDKMPQLNEIKKKYGPMGLQTVAVHMPRYEADTDWTRSTRR
jgi:thiol-disulfide isomerase/thioredoxin